jgi:hypothetical protein
MHRMDNFKINSSIRNSTDLEVEVWVSILRGGKDLSHLHHDHPNSGTGPASSIRKRVPVLQLKLAKLYNDHTPLFFTM